MTPKGLLLLCGIAPICVMACSSPETQTTPSSSEQMTEVTTTSSALVASDSAVDRSAGTTTVPPLPAQTYTQSDLEGLLLGSCPIERINEDTGETWASSIECTSDYAVGWPQRILDQMTSESEGESMWVIAKVNSRWTTVGVCNVFVPLSKPACSYPYDGTNQIVNESLLPPMNVQCVLWSGSRYSPEETGCPEESGI
jgi:hypothetical protein